MLKALSGEHGGIIYFTVCPVYVLNVYEFNEFCHFFEENTFQQEFL